MPERSLEAVGFGSISLRVAIPDGFSNNLASGGFQVGNQVAARQQLSLTRLN